MSRRRIEMHQYRQALVRMRAGDSDRQVAQQHLLGRHKARALRALASDRGWLQPAAAMPDDGVMAQALQGAQAPQRSASTISSLEPWRAQIRVWIEAGVQGAAIHAALQRQYGYQGSYSSVGRMMRSLKGEQAPQTTVRLDFAPGEAAQVDFGAGPMLEHPDGAPRRTWAFVMTLCHSRHQYVEFVWDQTVATWLGCHRRAFEWFNLETAVERACQCRDRRARQGANRSDSRSYREDL